MFAENTRIYCKMTQGWWTGGEATVGAYAWTDGQSSNAEWPGAQMAAVEGEDGLWAIDLDLSKFEKVIFTRLNPAGNEYWGAQTDDLIIPTDGKNLFTITSTEAQWEGEGKKAAGEWSKFVSWAEIVFTEAVAADGVAAKNGKGSVAAMYLSQLASGEMSPNQVLGNMRLLANEKKK